MHTYTQINGRSGRGAIFPSKRCRLLYLHCNPLHCIFSVRKINTLRCALEMNNTSIGTRGYGWCHLVQLEDFPLTLSMGDYFNYGEILLHNTKCGVPFTAETTMFFVAAKNANSGVVHFLARERTQQILYLETLKKLWYRSSLKIKPPKT